MSELPWKEGDALETLELPPVTRLDLVKYAGASGDYNPINTIDEAAEAAGLPGVIQHGMLTMAQMSRLVTPFLDRGFIERFYNRFTGMVFVGDVLRFDGTVTKVEDDDAHPRITVEVRAETAEGRKVAAGELRFVWTGAS